MTCDKNVGQWLIYQQITIAAHVSETRMTISWLVTGGHSAGSLGRRGQMCRWLASRSDLSAVCTTFRFRILDRGNSFGSFL